MSSAFLQTAYGSRINVSPNPAHNQLHIGLPNDNKEGKFVIRNTLGQVMNVPIQQTGPDYEVDVAQLPTGIYYLTYVLNSITYNTKFVKE